MVTPLLTTTRKSGSEFPLFHSLLREAYVAGSNPTPLKCPATAPILHAAPVNNKFQKGTMNRQEALTITDKQSDDQSINDIPITLQDPPKSKLKRQLSIETTDRTEAERIAKRHITRYPGSQTGTGNDAWSDEVDGFTKEVNISGRSRDSIVPDQVATNDVIKNSFDVKSYGKHSGNTVDLSRESTPESATVDANHAERKISNTRTTSQSHSSVYPSTSAFSQVRTAAEIRSFEYRSQGSVCAQGATGSAEYRDLRCTEETPPTLLSPASFNLRDISQTSPFISTTPNVQKENNVFIFPDQSTPKKISPYAQSTEQPETSSPLHRSNTPSRYSHISYSQYEQDRPSDYSPRKPHPDKRNQESEAVQGIPLPSYVSPRGFIWPKTPNLTQSSTYSPKKTSSEPKHTLPAYTDPRPRAMNSYDGYEDDYAKLCLLKREYSRAMQAYGYHARDANVCRSRNVNDVIRNERYKSQRSAEERSPNEKAIREIQEDVHNRYERSFSDPLYNPLHHRHLLRQASRLAREKIMEFGNDHTDDSMLNDKRRENWQQDYRLRLFMKSEPYAQRSLDRQVSMGTEIPHEVLEFLHSLNFHPEELENLKDYLRRGGGSESAQYCRGSNPGPVDGQCDFLQPPVAETEGQKRSPNSNVEVDMRQRQRERQLGDINVRLSCGGFQEKGGRQPEVDNDARDCKCVRIENEIRAMAMGAYSKIRGIEEFNATNSNVYDSMDVLRHIKSLCNHGRTIENIYTGSVVFTMNCPDIDALLDLWNMYKTGSLGRLMKEAFITENIKNKFNCDDIDLSVYISKEEYLTCKYELEASFQKKFLRASEKSPNIIHTRSRSEPVSCSNHGRILQPARLALSPFRERICSDSSVELSPRRVFKEINTRDGPRDHARDQLLPPHSPSKKYVSDNVFYSGDESQRSPLASISPLTSPRRKSFGTKFQFTETQQQENVEMAPGTTPSSSGTFV